MAVHICSGRTTARWVSKSLHGLHVGSCLHAAKTIVIFAGFFFRTDVLDIHAAAPPEVIFFAGVDVDDVTDDVAHDVDVDDFVDDDDAGEETDVKQSVTNAQVHTAAACLCLACSSNLHRIHQLECLG